MFRRGRPILRTAAIVGTASAVGGAVSHHQQQKYAAQDAAAQQQYAEPAPQQYAAPAPAEPDMTTELTQLAQLHSQGILTDEEFAAKKAQLLGI
jgi:putative oligomerization/nucleic acid binding protein